MTAPTNLYGGTSPDDLTALVNQLSGAATAQEMNAAGIETGTPDGSNQAALSDNHLVSQIRQAGAHVSLVGHSLAGKRQKRLNAEREAHNAAQAALYGQYMTDRANRLQQAKDELARRDQINKINAYFSSDSMQGLYDKLANEHFQNSLTQIVDQYGNQLRNTDFQTAGQGLVGSSVDAERRGQVQQGQDAATVQAQSQAQQYAQGVKSQNEQQRQSLVSTVQSGNPADAQAFNQQMQGIQNQTQQQANLYANQAAQANISQAGTNLQSQALGNLFSNLGGLYRTSQVNQAYGNNGSAY